MKWRMSGSRPTAQRRAVPVPALMVVAKDDPLVPFRVYDHPVFRGNACLRLMAVEHGGHIGFISRRRPRFWLDSVIIEWLEQIENKARTSHVS